jgi:hypothetical protein
VGRYGEQSGEPERRIGRVLQSLVLGRRRRVTAVVSLSFDPRLCNERIMDPASRPSCPSGETSYSVGIDCTDTAVSHGGAATSTAAGAAIGSILLLGICPLADASAWGVFGTHAGGSAGALAGHRNDKQTDSSRCQSTYMKCSKQMFGLGIVVFL